MKKYGVFIQVGVSFDSRSESYDLLEKFRQFLDESVPCENFDFQDIKLIYHGVELDIWGDRK